MIRWYLVPYRLTPQIFQETEKVLIIRERIKGFLASQGMLKGHAGIGSRDSEQVICRLVTDDYSSSSESPPGQTLTLPSADDYPLHHHRTSHHTSAMREQAWESGSSSYHSSGLTLPSLSLDISSYGVVHSPPPPRADSPYDSSSNNYDIFSYTALSHNSNSIVPCKLEDLYLM